MQSMRWFYPIAALFMAFVAYTCYFPSQDEFFRIVFPFAGAFAAYVWIAHNGASIGWKHIALLALLSRVLIIAAFPNLSDDVFRFIWDGRLAHVGINPMTVLPSQVVGIDPLFPETLFGQLNSPGYYTVYPPLAQWIFYISTIIQTETLWSEVIFMKVIVLLFDVGSMIGMVKLMRLMDLNPSLMAWYVLNPLVIIEISGNLHFEGIMICFIVWMIYFLQNSKFTLSGLALGFSVITKLLPLMFIPLIWFSQKKSKVLPMFFLSAMLVLLAFAPYIVGPISGGAGFSESLDLYMRKFEFNASLYYLLRWVGYGLYGFNMIHVVGPGLAAIVLLLLVYLAYRYGPGADYTLLIHLMLISFCVFLFCSMTVHPWYVCIPIALACFSKFRFPIVWSGLIFLTYINYSYDPYRENLWVVGIEYVVVFCVLLWEINRYGWLGQRSISTSRFETGP